jgi:hypothetical protein
MILFRQIGAAVERVRWVSGACGNLVSRTHEVRPARHTFGTDVAGIGPAGRNRVVVAVDGLARCKFITLP